MLNKISSMVDIGSFNEEVVNTFNGITILTLRYEMIISKQHKIVSVCDYAHLDVICIKLVGSNYI